MDKKKSVAVAYLLLLFFGGLGAHRFYLGSIKMAAFILAVTLLGITLIPYYGLGIIIIGIATIVCLVDLFLVPTIAKKKNLKIMLGLNLDPTKHAIVL